MDTQIRDAQKAATWLAYRRAAGQIKGRLSSDGTAWPTRVKAAFVGSFTVEPLVDFALVEAAACGIGLESYQAPYGQVSREILDPGSGLYAFAPQITVLMAEADSLAADPHAASDAVISLAQAFKKNATGILVVCTFMAPPGWPLHLLAADRQIAFNEANQQLKNAFKDDVRVQICDIDSLAAYYGYANASSPEMMAMARIPFSEGFLVRLAQKFVSHFKIYAGLVRKCLVLDCDNTLWGGVIGEDGMDGIVLGADWPGREYVEFQKSILELYEQGVILALNSKNNPDEVMGVLRTHPAMRLREEHFASIQVNWESKPENMKAIARDINIGLDSLVFVDDSPVEREIMRQTLPEVAVIELPENPALYERTLRQTNYFAKASLTEEDKNRGRSYAAQRQRSELQKTAPTVTEFLKSLEMVCDIRLAEAKDIRRVAQLTQRTNQFNLTTRRYTESEIEQRMESPLWKVYVLGLKDKFGDNGTVGLAMVEQQAEAWRIDTFLMSCRVIGRQAEEAMVDRICQNAVAAGAKELTAEYIKTPKNSVVSGFWGSMGFEKASTDADSAGYRLTLKGYKPKTFEYLALKN